MFALIDCNNFFVSCERLFRPDLQQIPVVVLSNNDGCVISRSEEAKEVGILMGAPFFKIHTVIQRHKVVVFSSNYSLYGDLSHRVMSTIEAAWPEVEIYSIDEAFLDLRTMPAAERLSFCQELQRTLLRNTGIPTSISLGETKTLAKVANYITKKIIKAPVFLLEEREKWLTKLPIEEVWGVGRRWSSTLSAQGIRSAWDLAKSDPCVVRKRFNVILMRTVMELNGVACLGFEETAVNRTILSSRSFGQMQTEEQPLAEALSSHVARVCEKARAHALCAKQVTLFVRSNPHRGDLFQYSRSLTCPLINPTNDTRVITRVVLEGLKQIYKPRIYYKKVGVILEDLISENTIQQDIFSPVNPKERARSQRLMSTMDQINSRFGRRSIRLATEGFSTGWQMRSAMRSPCYTTQWSDIPVVK